MISMSSMMMIFIQETFSLKVVFKSTSMLKTINLNIVFKGCNELGGINPALSYHSGILEYRVFIAFEQSENAYYF